MNNYILIILSMFLFSCGSESVEDNEIIETKDGKITQPRSKRVIKKLPPQEPYDEKLAKDFKALAKEKLGGYKVVKIIFRNNGIQQNS